MEDLTLERFVGRRCWLGLDLALVKDMSAVALIGEGDLVERTAVDEDGREYKKIEQEYLQALRFWLPETTVRAYSHLGEFVAWAETGCLEMTRGNTVDFAAIQAGLIEWIERFKPLALVCDMRFAEKLAQDVQAATGIEIIDFPQRLTQFAAPTAEFERLIIAGLMRHMAHPIMDWQIGHVEVIVRDKMKRPVKPDQNKDDHRKIDGIVAGVMALSRAIVAEDDGDDGTSDLEAMKALYR